MYEKNDNFVILREIENRNLATLNARVKNEFLDDVYRGSYESVMNGYSIGTGWSDYINSGTSSKGVQWDEIGQEAFAIQSLKFQGLHGMSANIDEDGNYTVTQNLNVGNLQGFTRNRII